MAAIHLCRGEVRPVLLDRDETVGDALCGGFLSWRTAERLRAVGIGPMQLGAHPVETLALIAGKSEAIASLPSPGFGLSRHALDTALRRRAVGEGARLVIDKARSVAPGVIEGEEAEHRSEAIFLASGKHDVRGAVRPRQDKDPALGIRIRLPAAEGLRTRLKGRIELHLFRGGYAGIVLQEDGSANVCLALRKSLLAEAGGNPRALLDRLASRHPRFADRMAFAPADLPVDSIGAVPYGFVAQTTEPGIWRLGDQAAVIPSLAGEGMAIAMESGAAAAQAWLAGHDAARFQREFALRAARPIRVARLIWHIAEIEPGARLLAGVSGAMPSLARAAMALTRI
ncbi:hypothetical protein A6F68_01741 [Tsuneonella dongtanensis]|uniref:FAD-binding domain-containing protein n=2 Tax=Tsuneonella dongtanensis TaxID=692370 RepID=A0A1B2ADL5_9SPHN|nr:hypothetical protein A6F68_01741 [Tsuneonella dongtanensis]